MTSLFTCPCCGYRTLPTGPGSYDLCPVCLWEDDGAMSTSDPTGWQGGPNSISLAQAQRRFVRYGSMGPLGRTRPPRPDEERDAEWQPFDDPNADPLEDFARDLSHVFVERAMEACKEARRESDDRALGRLEAWTDVVVFLKSQAQLFGLDADDLGLSSIDPADDLSPEPPTGRYAG